jgi:UDP-N-acetylmuramate dehydrogenase
MNTQKDFPLSNITTLKIGGSAKEFVVVNTQEELVNVLRENKNVLIIGGGSNLLIADEGVDKLVIKNEVTGIYPVIPATAGIQQTEKAWIPDQVGDDKEVMVKSGTPLQELVDYTIKNGFSGAQKLTGIPGTVGGAVFGNAAAYGQTISDYITEVICFDGQALKTVTKQECQFDYRDSGFKTNGLTILEIQFKFPKGSPKDLEAESKDILEKRLAKYKPGILCPGSFFKNVVIEKLTPEQKAMIPKERDYYGKAPAWYFLDEVGARGDKIGDIEIADFHGNLFINIGEGTASDFYKLAKKYFLKVKEKFGIELEPEVQLINLPPLNS